MSKITGQMEIIIWIVDNNGKKEYHGVFNCVGKQGEKWIEHSLETIQHRASQYILKSLKDE